MGLIKPRIVLAQCHLKQQNVKLYCNLWTDMQPQTDVRRRNSYHSAAVERNQWRLENTDTGYHFCLGTRTYVGEQRRALSPNPQRLSIHFGQKDFVDSSPHLPAHNALLLCWYKAGKQNRSADTNLHLSTPSGHSTRAPFRFPAPTNNPLEKPLWSACCGVITNTSMFLQPMTSITCWNKCPNTYLYESITVGEVPEQRLVHLVVARRGGFKFGAGAEAGPRAAAAQGAVLAQPVRDRLDAGVARVRRRLGTQRALLLQPVHTRAPTVAADQNQMIISHNNRAWFYWHCVKDHGSPQLNHGWPPPLGFRFSSRKATIENLKYWVRCWQKN